MLEEIEERIKELLGIRGRDLRYEGIIEREKNYRGRVYKYLEAKFLNKSTNKVKSIHLGRKYRNVIGELLKLDKEWRKEKEKRKQIYKETERLVKKFRDTNVIIESLQKSFETIIEKEKISYTLKFHTNKAKQLFEQFKETLIELYRERVFERLTILQVLYLLANLKELSNSQDNSKVFFKKGLSTIIRVVKNERIPNPFGTLKNDFFLSSVKTPYDFLLSNFLEEIIGETLRELLEKEIEKKKAKEEVREYKEKMEKLKEIAQWFESLPLEIKLLAKEIISGNVVEIAEKVLKDMKESGYELSKISAFLENSSRESLIEYFKYLKSL